MPGKYRQPCRACYHYVRADKNIERARKWRADNPGKNAEMCRRWALLHPGHDAKRWQKHRGRESAKNKRQYLRHRAKRLVHQGEYNRLNWDKVSKYKAAWDRSNPAKQVVYRNIRRARKANAVGTHTESDIRRLFELQRGHCACCRKPLLRYHVDHVIALASGGSNDFLNLQLLCPRCNQRKRAKDPVDFMQENGFLL